MEQGDFLYHEPLENSAKICFSGLPLEEGVEYARKSTYHSAPSFGNESQ